MTDDEHQAVAEIRAKVAKHEKIFAPEVEWLLTIVDRQAQEIASLTERVDRYRTALYDNECLIADMQGDCTCGAWEREDDDEADPIPLPPELEAMPDIQGFIIVQKVGHEATHYWWEPISGKRVEINGIVAILHENEWWRLTDLVSGVALGSDDDPVALIQSVREKLDDKVVERIRKQQAEHRAKMPPNEELDAIIAREVGM